MGLPHDFDDEAKGAFVLALQRLGNYQAAAAAVGFSVDTVWRHRKEDKDFAEACKRAKARLLGELLGVVREFAITGVVEKFYDKEGNLVREKKYISEKLLDKWLRVLAPEQWGEKLAVKEEGTVEHRHEHVGRIEVEKMTPAQRRAARQFLATFPAPEAGA